MSTHWRKLKDSEFLGSWDLLVNGQYQPLVVEITGYTKKEIHNGKSSKNDLVLLLKNQKSMVINATNGKAIESALGTYDIEKWPGRFITVEVKNVKSPNGIVPALRVSKIPPATTKPAKPDLNPNHEKWNGAIEALANGATTIQSIKTVYNVNDENLKELEKHVKM